MAKDGTPSTLTVIDRSAGFVESGDSLPVYMKALQKHSVPLKRDEEISLAETIRDSKYAIVASCCENQDFFTELFLLKDLALTEQKKLFLSLLDEDAKRADVLKLTEQLDRLIVAAVSKQGGAMDDLLDFLQQVNFTYQDLDRISKPLRESSSAKQNKRLDQLLHDFQIAKDRLIRTNLRLVFSRARYYQNRGMALEDLIQEGNLGLIKAVEKYDVSKGYKFGTYATWWINQALGRSVADKGRLIRIPVHMVENINKVAKATRSIVQRTGKDPTHEEISEESGLELEKIERVLDINIFPHSLETPENDLGAPLNEFLIDHETPDPHTVVRRKELTARVAFLLSKLDPREEKIIRMRFGIGMDGTNILKSIGKDLNVSGERVRQLLNRSMDKLIDYGNQPEGFEHDWSEFKKSNRNPKVGAN